MKNIIFIAPPAAGKGTQSNMLTNDYNYEHISTGDMLREEISSNTDLGKSIKNIIENGLLVSDDIIIELVKNKLLKLDGKPFILDGFPRTLQQAISLNDILNELDIDNYAVIYLNVSLEDALRRVVGRLMCSCGQSYNVNIEGLIPKVPGICDKCGNKLISRDDDNEDTMRKRFATFLENSDSILDYYKEKNKLSVIDVTDDIKEVNKNIVEIVND